jgi:hypothetical protein
MPLDADPVPPVPDPKDPSTWGEDADGLPIIPPGYIPGPPVPPDPLRDADGEPLRNPSADLPGYRVDVRIGDKPVTSAFAGTPRELEALLLTLGQRYAFPPQFYDENLNPEPRPLTLFAVFDRARELWVKADGVSEMPPGATWQNVEVKLHIGAVILPK